MGKLSQIKKALKASQSNTGAFRKALEDEYPYANPVGKASKYEERKKSINKWMKNAKLDNSEGKATVMPNFVKDKKAEAHLKSVKEYNKSRDTQIAEWEDKFRQGEDIIENGISVSPELAKLQEEYNKMDLDYWDVRDKWCDGKISTEEWEAFEKRYHQLSRDIGELEDDIGYDSDAIDELKGIVEEFEDGKVPHQVTFKLPGIKSMSPQENITRYHTTEMLNLPGIYKNGLLTSKGGKGYSKVLLKQGADRDELREVYTTSRHPFGASETYTPFDERTVTLELQIPKEDYRKLRRNDTNPEEYYTPFWDENENKLLETVQNGGRTDIFSENLKPAYIKGAYNDVGDYNSIEDVIKNYNCAGAGNCEEWYDTLEDLGFIIPHDDGGDSWNDDLFMRLRHRK